MIPIRLLTAAMVLGAWCAAIGAARAESSGAWRLYGRDQGLVDLGAACLAQDRAQNLLVCSDRGLFVFDGRHFVNLGPDQGLPDGGVVEEVATMPDGRIVVRFANVLYLSRTAPDLTHPVRALRFAEVGGIAFYLETQRRMVLWQGHLLFLLPGALAELTSAGPRPALVPFALPAAASGAILARATGIFSVAGGLWVRDGEAGLCRIDGAAPRCFGAADGLPAGPWLGLAADADGHLVARSVGGVATFDGRDRWHAEALPDQSAAYAGYAGVLDLFRGPGGLLMTQAAHGVLVKYPSGWRELTAPGPFHDVVVGALTDRMGDIWLKLYGHGIARWTGFDQFQNISAADGLQPSLPWQTVAGPDGAIWVTTDAGVDRIELHAGGVDDRRLAITHATAAGSFALARTGDTLLFSQPGGFRALNAVTGAAQDVDCPPVNAITVGREVWIATERGLYRAVRDAGGAWRAVPVSRRTEAIVWTAESADGWLYYTAAGELRRTRVPDQDALVVAHWPDRHFVPVVVMAGRAGPEGRVGEAGRADQVWVAGNGDLYRVDMRDGVAPAVQVFPRGDIGNGEVSALMIDRRGWLWVGHDGGLSVFDGTRWVTLSADQGLGPSDVDQGGLMEDTDGTIWITTPEGLSHLVHPERVFEQHGFDVRLSHAAIGARPIMGGEARYSSRPLNIELSATAMGLSKSLTFRYELTGVDGEWETTNSGVIRYPFLPPGAHVLRVVAVDGMSHVQTRELDLPIRMRFPWWRQWWSVTLAAAGVLGLAAGFHRLRTRRLLRRQETLQRHVEQATRELREAQVELAYAAGHDHLTGLLVRSEIEKMLSDRLADAGSRQRTAVALLDLDLFKRINDLHGHSCGDAVLRMTAALIAEALSEEGVAGRYGGEEFLLVLTVPDLGRAHVVLDRLCRLMRERAFVAKGVEIAVTCSIGFAAPGGGEQADALIERADQALYEAKRGGRDRVVLASAVASG